jgi:endonuclease/exonuclease/phosphatase family metal-dependent hydrolase
MRLLTWNACRGPFERKLALLDALEADILVLQEVAAPKTPSEGVLWFGDNPKQGVAVIARGAYSLRRIDERPGAPKYVVPIAVDGPEPFLLFAVWTLGTRPLRYVRALHAALDLYADLFEAHPVVLLGDFNSNAIWDHEHPAERSHSALVARMKGLGLVSAYHHHRKEPHGEEATPTFYLHWDEAKPFHLDYCFLLRAWAKRIKQVDVGSFEYWKPFSDHRPLWVDLAPMAKSSPHRAKAAG